MTTTIKCPYCDFEIIGGSPHFAARLEVIHMNHKHPDIVEQRLIAAGFVKNADGKWIDTKSDPYA
jgi:hypothetical protein